MQPTRDQLTDSERRMYALIQAICLALAVSAFAVLLADVSIHAKWFSFGAAVALLVGAVIFNWGRRYGIRVLWSKRFRGQSEANQ